MDEFGNRVPGAFLLGVIVATAIIGLPFGPFWLLAFLLAIIPTLILSCIVGLPLFCLARRKQLAHWWTAILGGLATGETLPAFMLAFDPDKNEALSAAALLGVAGMAGGLVFWLWARHGPQHPFR